MSKLRMDNYASTRRWALRGYPASRGRKGPYHGGPFLFKIGQLNVRPKERAGLIAVYRTKEAAALAKKQGVRRICPKIDIVRVIVHVTVQQGAR